VEADNKPPVVPSADSLIIVESNQEMNDVKMNTVAADSDSPKPNSTVDNIVETRTGELSAHLSQVDTPDVLVRFREKNKLHWTGKTCAFN
jgi:tRNA-dihydrouridine synthase 3